VMEKLEGWAKQQGIEGQGIEEQIAEGTAV
jgi:hypothetical protein